MAATPSQASIAAILAALATDDPADDLPVERPRATRRLEVSA
jgi:hypothetical protein